MTKRRTSEEVAAEREAKARSKAAKEARRQHERDMRERERQERAEYRQRVRDRNKEIAEEERKADREYTWAPERRAAVMAAVWTPERRAAASARSKELWASKQRREQAAAKRSETLKRLWADPHFRLAKLEELAANQPGGVAYSSLQAKIDEARAQVEALDELL